MGGRRARAGAAGWRRRLRPGLAVRVVMPLVLATLTALALVMLVITPRLQARVVDQATDDSAAMLRAVAVTLAAPLRRGDDAAVFAILDAIAAEQPEWLAVRLEDADGAQVFPMRPLALPRAGPRLARQAATVGTAPAPLGRLEIAKDLGPLIDGAHEEAMTLALMLAGTLGLLVLWSAWALSIGVIDPILRLREAAEALARRDYAAALPAPPGHEVGDLVESFTWMREQLAAAEHSAMAQRNAELSGLLARERELHRNARLLEQIVRNTNAGIAVVERRGDLRPIRRVNDAFSRLTGLTAGDAAGTDLLARLDFETPTDRARLSARTADGRHGLVGEARLLDDEGRPNGTWVEIATVRIEDPREQVEMIAVMLRDVTRRRAAEQALREQRDGAVAEAEAKSRFVAAVSHELRTPMTAITGIADILLDTPLDEEQHMHVNTILGASTALVDVVNDVLDYSRLEAGRLAPRREPLALAPLLESVAQLLEPLARAKGLRFERAIDPGLPPHVLGDETRLRQCLVNLLGNAIKFTRRGHVRLAAEAVENGLSLVVSDTGPGIGPADHARIFEPFRQAHNAAGSVGSGLGLAITAALVGAMQGRIALDSTPGRGSRFTLTLPLERAARPPEAMASPSGAAEALSSGGAAGGVADLSRLGILVVDDNDTNRIVLRQMLRTAGARVTLAADGEEALARIAGDRPDLVLMDVTMPRLDGLAVTRRQRREEAAAGTPPVVILGLSAGSAEDERRRCLAAGMDGFIAKPVRKAALVAACAAALRGTTLQAAS